jgi:hypothetical protein
MPARLRDLARALQALGVTVEPPSSGSHFKARRGSIVFPIPAHNGPKTEIDDRYIRAACRAFDLDESELRKLL